MQTSNRKCKELVNTLTPFQGSNLRARFIGAYYVVESYGWYPIYAKIKRTWYEIDNGYSPSTKRQMSYAKPTAKTKIVSHEKMKELINY